MKRSNCLAVVSNHWMNRVTIGSLLLGFILPSAAGLAEDEVSPPSSAAVSPPSSAAVSPPGPSAAQPGGSQVLAPLGVTPLLSHEGPLAQWGVVSVRPHLFYRLLYGDGIQASLGQPETTAIQELSPGILLGLGTHWNLDYTPSWTVYSNRAFRNTLDHSASLTGGAGYGDWHFGFSQSYVSDNPVLVETGQQTRQDLYATSLTASGHIGPRTLLDLAVSQNVRFADGFAGFREWSTSDFLHYQITSRLDAGIGSEFGYVNMDVGPNMTYVRPEGRITWKPADKIAFTVQGGNERRTFDSGGTGAMTSPVYSASVQYLPVETTTLNFGVNRDLSASYFADEITKSQSWSASLQQRLLQEFYFNAAFSQGKTTYAATRSGLGVGRDDRNYAVTVRLSTTFLRRGSVAILYQLSHNSSNSSVYAFSSRQVGLELGYSF